MPNLVPLEGDPCLKPPATSCTRKGKGVRVLLCCLLVLGICEGNRDALFLLVPILPVIGQLFWSSPRAAGGQRALLSGRPCACNSKRKCKDLLGSVYYFVLTFCAARGRPAGLTHVTVRRAGGHIIVLLSCTGDKVCR